MKPPYSQPQGVKDISIGDLFPNPHNPRMLFDKLPMEKLRDSIERVGILVPLTVYWDPARSRYVILDGQRRWMCSKAAGRKTVPVNIVAEPTLVQNIVTMFQIHKLREDWELMPTALKIDLLMKEIGDKNEGRLAALTGLDEAVIVRCKKLVSYPKEFQDMMLDSDPELRVKADFFIELYPVLHDRDVTKFSWFAPKKFIKQMLVKYQQEPRTIKSVTDFRRVKQCITAARKINALPALSRKLEEFATNAAAPVESLEIAAATVHTEAKALERKLEALAISVQALDAEQFYGEENLWASMVNLIKILEQKLRAADKRR